MILVSNDLLKSIFPDVDFSDYNKWHNIVIKDTDGTYSQDWHVLMSMITDEFPSEAVGTLSKIYFENKKYIEAFLSRIGTDRNTVKLYGSTVIEEDGFEHLYRYGMVNEDYEAMFRWCQYEDKETGLSCLNIQKISLDDYLYSVSYGELKLEQDFGFSSVPKTEKFRARMDELGKAKEHSSSNVSNTEENFDKSDYDEFEAIPGDATAEFELSLNSDDY